MKLSKKKMSILFIVAVLICIIIVIIIYYIWQPNIKQQINKYAPVTEIENRIGELYGREIRNMLLDNNNEELFKLLDKDFLIQNNLNMDNYFNFLKDNNYIGDDPTIKTYYIQKKDDIYFIKYEYVVKGEVKYVTLIETFPYQYTLSFKQEGVPIIDNEILNSKFDGLNFNIQEIESNNTSIKYRIQITNSDYQNVEFNFNSINNLVLNMSDGGRVRMSTTVANQRKETIKKGGYFVREAMFNVGLSNQSKIIGMTFKDILVDGNSKDISIVF